MGGLISLILGYDHSKHDRNKSYSGHHFDHKPPPTNISMFKNDKTTQRLTGRARYLKNPNLVSISQGSSGSEFQSLLPIPTDSGDIMKPIDSNPKSH